MEQFILFLYSFCLGFILGGFYQLICVIARLAVHAWVKYLLDIFYSFVCVASFIALSVQLCNGTFYAFMASSTLAGIALFILIKDTVKNNKKLSK